jgi:hypothetical protein
MSEHCDQAAQIFDGQFLIAKSARTKSVPFGARAAVA